VAIAGGFLNTSGAPLWLQSLKFLDAPSPGALFVSHALADTTLIDVAIEAARGFGVVHDGGRLEAWGLTLADTGVASLPPLPAGPAGSFGDPGNAAALLNGLAPAWSPFPNINEAFLSAACFGGIDVADGAMLLANGVSMFGNAPVGIVLRRDSIADLTGLEVTVSVAGDQGDWGDNISAGTSFLSLSAFSSTHADRAGLLLFDSECNLSDGTLTSNEYGIVSLGSSALYADEVTNAGNIEDLFDVSGDLTVADEPLEVPPPD
jgi:hypothetical protein